MNKLELKKVIVDGNEFYQYHDLLLDNNIQKDCHLIDLINQYSDLYNTIRSQKKEFYYKQNIRDLLIFMGSAMVFLIIINPLVIEWLILLMIALLLGINMIDIFKLSDKVNHNLISSLDLDMMIDKAEKVIKEELRHQKTMVNQDYNEHQILKKDDYYLHEEVHEATQLDSQHGYQKIIGAIKPKR